MKIKLLTIIIFLLCMPAWSYNLDTSINKEIQNKYDANKLNEDMKISTPPSDPKTTSNFNKTPNKAPNIKLNFEENENINIINPQSNSQYKQSGIIIPKWTSFKVKSNQKISNWLSIGSVVSFTTTSPVYKKNITIGSGTIFKGKVTKIHSAQITGNGALVEIKITHMIYNGKTYPTDGKITKANSKLVFFSKLKGNRQYLNGVENKINRATNFYKKARNMSNKLAQNPFGVILAPIPTIIGFAGGTIGTVSSPLTGLIQKGRNISLPAGTNYEIKILSDIYIQ